MSIDTTDSVTPVNAVNLSSASKVLYTVNEQGVATVTLNNGEKHNAFDNVIIQTLTDIFKDIAKRDDVNDSALEFDVYVTSGLYPNVTLSRSLPFK